MSLPSYSEPYKSPNIVIVPTVSFVKKNDLKLHDKQDAVLKQKVAEGNQEAVVQNSEKKDGQIKNIGASNAEQPKSASKETPCYEDLNKNLAKTIYLNKTKASNSCAPSYLQSIWHNNITPIKLNLSCKPKVHKIETVSSNKKTVSVSSSGYFQSLSLKDPTATSNVVPNTSKFPGITVSYIDNNEMARTHANTTNNFNTLVNENSHVPYLPNLPLALPWRENESTNGNICMPHIYETPRGFEMPLILPQCYQSSPVNPKVVLDTTYSTPTYATIANNNNEATYCYPEGASIYDTISHEINKPINFPNKTQDGGKVPTRERRENFASSLKTKTSPSPRKTENSIGLCKEYATEIGNEKQSKISEESRAIKKRTSEKNRIRQSKNKISMTKELSPKIKSKISKNESSVKEQHVNKQHAKNDENHNNAKQQNNKASGSQSKNHSFERRKLKPIRHDSDDSFISDLSSPIRSTIQKPDFCDERFDLRYKINERINKRRLNMDHDSQPLNKKPRNTNLNIKVESDTTHTSPKIACGPKYKSKAKKCRTVRLIIDVVCHDSDESSNDSSDSSCSDVDLSFLDDFNIDEIVDSLKLIPEINSPIKTKKVEIEIEEKPSKSSLVAVKPENIVERPLTNEPLEESFGNDIMNDHKSCIVDITENKVNAPLTTIPYHRSLNEMQYSQTGQLENPFEQGAMAKYANKDLTENKPIKQEINVDNATVIRAVSPMDVIAQNGIEGAREDYIIDLTIIGQDDNPDSNDLLKKKAIKSFSEEIKETSEKPTELNFQSVKSIIVDPVDLVIHHEVGQINGDCQDDITSDIGTENGISNTSEGISIDYENDKEDLSVGEESMNTFKKTFEFNAKSLKEKCTNVYKQTILDAAEQIKSDCQENTSDNATVTLRSQESIPPSISSNKIDKSEIGEKQFETAEEFMEINAEPVKMSDIDEELKTADELAKIIAEVYKNIRAYNQIDTSIINNELIKTIEEPMEVNVELKKMNVEPVKEMADNKIETPVINQELIKTAEEPMEINAEPVKETADIKNDTSVIDNEYIKTAEDSTEIIAELVKVKADMKNCTSEIGNGHIKKAENQIEINAERVKENAHNNIDTSEKDKKPSKTAEPIKDNIFKVKIESYQLPVLEITLDSKNIKKHNEDNIKIKDESTRGIVNNVSEINNAVGNTKDKIPIENKRIQTKKVVNEVVDILAARLTNTKDSVDNKNVTISKQETSKTTNASLKKDDIKSNLTGKYKSLADTLEERMLEYMHKSMSVISIIKNGRFSDIFMCKDINGQKYAAKVIKTQDKRIQLGLEKERMYRKIQECIPRDNLYTVYLIEGFGVQRYWCHLMEYYPLNLEQALWIQKKPFHIDRVQALARQLISAVMVLRNNDIIHSDIKPSHILINETNDKIKLCGFDRAYYGYPVDALPRISSPTNRAPELILGYSAGYSIDVWCSALVIQEMATKRQLFVGICNNDILFQQMCIFGGLPWDMILKSPLSKQYFFGLTFMKRVGFQGQNKIMCDKFHKTKILLRTLKGAYSDHWAQIRGPHKYADLIKLHKMALLLDKMLELDPRRRLAIEFVCADPFIYEMFEDV